MSEDRYILRISPALYDDLKKIANRHGESILETIRNFFKDLTGSNNGVGVLWVEHPGRSQHDDGDES